MKRIFDLLVSIILLLLFFPILIIIGIIILIKGRPPILFKQPRLGYKGKIFKLYKFRTMRNSVNSSNNHVDDQKRITSVGRFLRKTSLDELPELINVLLGDMSLVGPRPLLVQYQKRYDKFQKRRHEVKPGITGLAQINGRNILSWEERFAYDIQYIDNYSFLLDITILLRTVGQVLTMRGISPEKEEIMPEFKGSSRKK